MCCGALLFLRVAKIGRALMVDCIPAHWFPVRVERIFYALRLPDTTGGVLASAPPNSNAFGPSRLRFLALARLLPSGAGTSMGVQLGGERKTAKGRRLERGIWSLKWRASAVVVSVS